MDFLFAFITSLFITMVIMPLLMNVAERWKFVDVPNDRKVHTRKIPRIGGLAMVLAVLISVLLWVDKSTIVIYYLLGVLVILVFGAWDDRDDINYKIKFAGQFLAILLPVVFGGVQIIHLPFLPLDYQLPSMISIPLTIFCLLGVTNAINLSDGLDGLAGGTSLLAIGLLALLAYLGDGHQAVLVSLAVIGSIVGFLRFNTHPAQVFMGDCGSQFLGFSAGVLAIYITQEVNTALSSALPLLILGLPILDTLTVMVQRISEGKSPFLADKNHIHHKFLALKFDHHEAVFWIYVIQSAFIIGAYTLRYNSDWLIILLYGLFCLSLISFIRYAEQSDWTMHSDNDTEQTHFITRHIKWFRDRPRLSRWSFYLASITLPVYLVIIFASNSAISSDIGLLALLLLGLLIASQVLIRNKRDAVLWLEKACMYITISIIVYLAETGDAANVNIETVLNIILVLVAVAVALNIRYGREKNFSPTPLDYLVVFTALALPILPVGSVYNINPGVALTKLIVLFYGIELLLGKLDKASISSKIVLYLSLVWIGIKGVVLI